MAMQQRTNQIVQQERMKTNAAGIGGVFFGIGAGQLIGGAVGKAVDPTGGKKSSGVSIVTKIILGIVIIMFNSLGGLAGVFVLGISWGVVGSTIVDVVALSGKSLEEYSVKVARAMRSASMGTKAAADVYIEEAGVVEQVPKRIATTQAHQAGRKVATTSI